MFVEILLNKSVSELDRLFTYLVPIELEKNVDIGKRVKVPFGRGNKEEIGIIVNITNKTDCPINKLKQIIEIIDNKPIITKFNILLAKWMAKKYVCNLSDSVRLMMPPGITKSNNKIASEKMNKWICLTNKEELLVRYNEIKGLTTKRKEVLELLLEYEEILQKDLYDYFNITAQFLKWFIDNKLITIEEEKVYRNPFEKYEVQKEELKKLNKEQQNVYETICEQIDENKFYSNLIHGVTGSGKTEVYMHIIRYILSKEKNAIILVPEISLTPQIVNRFLSRFGNIVAILHSRLSIGEKLDEYNRIKSGEAKIVIGARSAIFAPLNNIGTIIIDEEHDSSYKSEMSPKYDAREIAEKICQKNKCPLILGSATPSITTYYKTQNGDMNLLCMNKRANNANMPEINIIDLLETPIQSGFSNITTQLYEQIQKNIENKEQTILFLNKRGFYSSIVCKECGFVYKCPNCDVSLTYHNDKRKLICHYCGHTEIPKNSCIMCGGSNFDKNVIGTQKIEQELKNNFPNVSVIRMDHDTTVKKNAYLEIINKFKKENIDILIGTQMVVKGHDFPNVTLVGILNSDMTLNSQEFNANESTFNLLTQVSGRAGRKDKKGRVYIQTYNKDNSIFEYIKNNEYIAMYRSEINYRKSLTYPPFCDIIQINVSGKNEDNVEETSKKIYQDLKIIMNGYIEKNIMILYSPVIANISKINNQYRWKILIKCKYNESIADTLKQINNSNKYKDVKIGVNINPNNNI